MATEENKAEAKLKSEELVYRGAYNYFQNGVNYCTETFNVFKNSSTLVHTFKSEVLSRMENGEFLKINIDYRIDTGFVPLDVFITRFIGNQIIQEVYIVNQKENKLTYSFIHNGEEMKQVLDVPAKFQITTPAVCTSGLIYLNKKYDPTTLNRYLVVVSPNEFKYIGDIGKKNVYLRSKGSIGDEIVITDKKLKATAFYLYESDDIDKSEEIPISIYLSKHMSIPYMIEAGNNIRVEIKFINKLQTKKFEDIYQGNEDNGDETV